MNILEIMDLRIIMKHLNKTNKNITRGTCKYLLPNSSIQDSQLTVSFDKQVKK